MALEDFKQTYLRLCKEHRVEPQDVVMNQVLSAQKNPKKSGGYCLNLSTHSLTSKTCGVLAKALATDRAFTEIKLNDCMLTEEGMKALAMGLSNNVACRKLDLKGNNVRGTAAEGLGRMLRQNKHLLSLCLEWNAMGMLGTSFSVFCEGLGSSPCLQVLDLRNNQINHDGTSELAAALKRNTVLRSLDLRWNNVGLLGGRALLNALDYNKSLVKVELAGNNTPNDILRAIETAAAHNADRATVTKEYASRNHMLSQEIQGMKKGRVNEMTELLDHMERQESAMRSSTRSAQDKIDQLQQALSDRKSQFNDLASKLSLIESELALSESKVNELGVLLSKARDEQAENGKLHQSDLKREREEKALVEGKLNKELIETNERNMQLENKLDELERKSKSQQELIYDLKEQLAHSQADYKMKSSQYEERIQLEKQKTKEAYRDAEALKQKEVERVRRDGEETEQNLKERIQKLELQRIELEEEISRQKSNLASEKLHGEEHLLLTKQKLKNEEEHRCHQLEEKIRMLQTSKDELQAHATNQSANISDLQSKNANLTLENEGLRRKIEDLNQDLGGKNNEIMAEVGKTRLELNQKIQRLETERQSQSELYDRVARLERELAEASNKHKAAATTAEHEIGELREKVRLRDEDIRRMKEDDAQRAAILSNAIQNYVEKSPYKPR